MYYIIQTKEKGRKVIFVCPNEWIKNDILFWPNSDKHLKSALKAKVSPMENWIKITKFKILESNIGK